MSFAWEVIISLIFLVVMIVWFFLIMRINYYYGRELPIKQRHPNYADRYGKPLPHPPILSYPPMSIEERIKINRPPSPNQQFNILKLKSGRYAIVESWSLLKMGDSGWCHPLHGKILRKFDTEEEAKKWLEDNTFEDGKPVPPPLMTVRERRREEKK